MMKKLLFIAICVFAFASARAQYKFPPLDTSPADIAYYPFDAAHVKKIPQVKVVYSRPSKKGRVIFGDTTGLQRYGKVWRVGANEETEITFYTPVKMGGKDFQPGTYGLFAIPYKDKWTIIVNANLNKWGIYYDSEKLVEKDLMRFDVPVKNLSDVVEALSIYFLPATDGTTMVIGWDTTAVEIPITFTK